MEMQREVYQPRNEEKVDAVHRGMLTEGKPESPATLVVVQMQDQPFHLTAEKADAQTEGRAGSYTVQQGSH